MNSMAQRLKARIRDAALVVMAVLCGTIGVVLEEPMTEAVRAAVTPAEAVRARASGRGLWAGMFEMPWDRRGDVKRGERL